MARNYAAVIAPVLVLAALLFLGATTPGYDPISQTISELGTGIRGTRIIAIYGFIVITCVWEPIAEALGVKVSTAALIFALMVIGIGCFGLGMVAPESWPWNSMTWRGTLHLIFAFVFVFAFIPLACLAASRALPKAWRALRAYSLVMGLGTFVLLGATLTALTASPPNPYANSHLGLIERIYVFAFLIWQCIVSASVARSAPNAR